MIHGSGYGIGKLVGLACNRVVDVRNRWATKRSVPRNVRLLTHLNNFIGMLEEGDTIVFQSKERGYMWHLPDGWSRFTQIGASLFEGENLVSLRELSDAANMNASERHQLRGELINVYSQAPQGAIHFDILNPHYKSRSFFEGATIEVPTVIERPRLKFEYISKGAQETVAQFDAVLKKHNLIE